MGPADAAPGAARGEVCALADLADPGAREFRLGEGDWPLRLIVVRVGDAAYGYRNRCPHAGHALNLLADDFLTPDGALLICRSHGAAFERSTGRCVAGPCLGAGLEPIALQVVAGGVRLAGER